MTSDTSKILWYKVCHNFLIFLSFYWVQKCFPWRSEKITWLWSQNLILWFYTLEHTLEYCGFMVSMIEGVILMNISVFMVESLFQIITGGEAIIDLKAGSLFFILWRRANYNITGGEPIFDFKAGSLVKASLLLILRQGAYFLFYGGEPIIILQAGSLFLILQAGSQ